jgi:hypothetical protein
MVIVAAALVAGPALAAAPAYARDGHQEGPEMGHQDGQTVSFTGGSLLGMLVCRSEPSEGRLTIPAESRVMFVNRLGQNATLRVNGQALVQVGPNQAAPVVFHHGPVTVSMTFSCGAGVVTQFSSTSVSVTGAGRQAPPPGATPRPTSSAPARPAYSAPAKAHAGNSGRAALSPAQPSAGIPAQRSAKVPVAATADSPAPDRSGAAADRSGANPSTADPSRGGVSSGSGKGGNAVAVEPLVWASGTPRENASGLLALVAAVFAVCVTIAATRAIIVKRTIPTPYA